MNDSEQQGITKIQLFKERNKLAIKKSEIYNQLWAAADKLGGGVDPARYKNYYLTMLFVKYVSDKYTTSDDWEIEIP